MRVLISAGWLGGAGGAERALYSMVQALRADEVDVVVRERLGGPWARVPSETRVAASSSVHWYGAGHQLGVKGMVMQRLANPVRRVLGNRYDVYLQTMAGANLGSAVSVPVRLLVPSGNTVPDTMTSQFTAVAMQAPDNIRFVPAGMRSTLLPPPVYDLAERSDPPADAVPERFLLTVFNPYGPVKGLSDLGRVADDSPLPIVWCHSEATVRFEIPDELLHHDGIIHVTDATPEQLRYLYEHCAAYVSLSLSEGFGWSAADALRYSPAVVTRPIGVFSNALDEMGGVTLVSSPTDVDWDVVLASAAPAAERDLSLLEPSRFRSRLHRAAHELAG